MSIFSLLIIMLLLISAFLCFIAIARRQGLASKIVAFDLLTNITVALIAVFAWRRHLEVYIDMVLVVVLIMFLGTTIFARYLDGLKRKDDER